MRGSFFSLMLSIFFSVCLSVFCSMLPVFSDVFEFSRFFQVSFNYFPNPFCKSVFTTVCKSVFSIFFSFLLVVQFVMFLSLMSLFFEFGFWFLIFSIMSWIDLLTLCFQFLFLKYVCFCE